MAANKAMRPKTNMLLCVFIFLLNSDFMFELRTKEDPSYDGFLSHSVTILISGIRVDIRIRLSDG
jgi:hypothetical protein